MNELNELNVLDMTLLVCTLVAATVYVVHKIIQRASPNRKSQCDGCSCSSETNPDNGQIIVEMSKKRNV